MHFLRYSFHTERELVKRKGVGTKHFNQNNSPDFFFFSCKATIKAFPDTRFEDELWLLVSWWFLLTEMLLVMIYRCAQYENRSIQKRRVHWNNLAFFEEEEKWGGNQSSITGINVLHSINNNNSGISDTLSCSSKWETHLICTWSWEHQQEEFVKWRCICNHLT